MQMPTKKGGSVPFKGREGKDGPLDTDNPPKSPKEKKDKK